METESANGNNQSPSQTNNSIVSNPVRDTLEHAEPSLKDGPQQQQGPLPSDRPETGPFAPQSGSKTNDQALDISVPAHGAAMADAASTPGSAEENGTESGSGVSEVTSSDHDVRAEDNGPGARVHPSQEFGPRATAAAPPQPEVGNMQGSIAVAARGAGLPAVLEGRHGLDSAASIGPRSSSNQQPQPQLPALQVPASLGLAQTPAAAQLRSEPLQHQHDGRPRTAPQSKSDVWYNALLAVSASETGVTPAKLDATLASMDSAIHSLQPRPRRQRRVVRGTDQLTFSTSRIYLLRLTEALLSALGFSASATGDLRHDFLLVYRYLKPSAQARTGSRMHEIELISMNPGELKECHCRLYFDSSSESGSEEDEAAVARALISSTRRRQHQPPTTSSSSSAEAVEPATTAPPASTSSSSSSSADESTAPLVVPPAMLSASTPSSSSSSLAAAAAVLPLVTETPSASATTAPATEASLRQTSTQPPSAALESTMDDDDDDDDDQSSQVQSEGSGERVTFRVRHADKFLVESAYAKRLRRTILASGVDLSDPAILTLKSGSAKRRRSALRALTTSMAAAALSAGVIQPSDLGLPPLRRIAKTGMLLMTPLPPMDENARRAAIQHWRKQARRRYSSPSQRRGAVPPQRMTGLRQPNRKRSRRDDELPPPTVPVIAGHEQVSPYEQPGFAPDGFASAASAAAQLSAAPQHGDASLLRASSSSSAARSGMSYASPYMMNPLASSSHAGLPFGLSPPIPGLPQLPLPPQLQSRAPSVAHSSFSEAHGSVDDPVNAPLLELAQAVSRPELLISPTPASSVGFTANNPLPSPSYSWQQQGALLQGSAHNHPPKSSSSSARQNAPVGAPTSLAGPEGEAGEGSAPDAKRARMRSDQTSPTELAAAAAAAMTDSGTQHSTMVQLAISGDITVVALQRIRAEMASSPATSPAQLEEMDIAISVAKRRQEQKRQRRRANKEAGRSSSRASSSRAASAYMDDSSSVDSRNGGSILSSGALPPERRQLPVPTALPHETRPGALYSAHQLKPALEQELSTSLGQARASPASSSSSSHARGMQQSQWTRPSPVPSVRAEPGSSLHARSQQGFAFNFADGVPAAPLPPLELLQAPGGVPTWLQSDAGSFMDDMQSVRPLRVHMRSAGDSGAIAGPHRMWEQGSQAVTSRAPSGRRRERGDSGRESAGSRSAMPPPPPRTALLARGARGVASGPVDLMALAQMARQNTQLPPRRQESSPTISRTSSSSSAASAPSAGDVVPVRTHLRSAASHPPPPMAQQVDEATTWNQLLTPSSSSSSGAQTAPASAGAQRQAMQAGMQLPSQRGAVAAGMLNPPAASTNPADALAFYQGVERSMTDNLSFLQRRLQEIRSTKERLAMVTLAASAAAAMAHRQPTGPPPPAGDSVVNELRRALDSVIQQQHHMMPPHQ